MLVVETKELRDNMRWRKWGYKIW